ncbi:hypothetical protein [Alkalimonas mucilaginosa]|uniref:Uncharacterized protein n=1 Tax=Alkalimonas mucilaginosa TaxID=3057676 RepID=A0ABU7JIZ4_9GAMM|nr:hypothetical protein [Alkalimonas sp. MEB004]MEE2025060.1 hypothetical protein [Alkalimonas sp. MEB004]
MKKKTLSQRAWEWIKEQPDFGSAELAAHMDVSLKSAQMVIAHLQDLKAIETTSQGVKPVVYQAVPGANPHLPGKNTTAVRPKSQRQRIWQAARFLGEFTIADIQATAECSRNSIERYLCDLVRFEYVVIKRGLNRKASMKERTGRPVRYRLSKNTGHKYPIVRDNGLYDQNLKVLVPKPVRISKQQKELNHAMA